MSEVTGPISTLAGALHSVPTGVMCDEHADRPATRRVQCETDSFGCEMADMCDECYAAHKTAMAAYRDEARTGECEWCKSAATDLRDRRDSDEGLYGRVYRVCGACVTRENKRAQEEADYYGYNDDYGD